MHLIVCYYFYSINIPQGITIQSGYLIIWVFVDKFIYFKKTYNAKNKKKTIID